MNCWSATTRLAQNFLRNARSYSRKGSRNPIKILANDETTDKLKKLRPVDEEFVTKFEKPSLETPNADGEEPAFLKSSKLSRLPPGFPPYENKGHDDASLCQFALATSSTKSRSKSGLIMLEGKRLIQEGVDANLTLKALFFSQVDDVTSLNLPPKRFKFQKLTYERLKRWSKLTTPPGVIGFFQMPDVTAQAAREFFPFSIICDNVRDPGNLGSILRVAASSGCRSIYLTKGCVDLWNDKVLRSAMGSHFYLTIYDNMDWKQLELVLEPDAFLMFADNNDSEQVASDKIIYNDESEKHSVESNQSESTNLSIEEQGKKIPVLPYYLINYPAMKNIFLVLGGETGLSPNALDLGQSQNKFRVNIPMLNNVESLNVTSALSILTYEMKRQFELTDVKNEKESMTVPSV